MNRLLIAAAMVTAASTILAADLATELAGHWTLASGRDEQSWEDVVTLSVDSGNEIADEYATKMVHPQLVFRCTPGGNSAVSLQVDWRRFISSFNTEVGFKADDRELLLVNWGVDKSNKVTLPRSAKDGRELIDYLSGASRLQVEVIPYSESLITANFDITGVDGALQALADACR